MSTTAPAQGYDAFLAQFLKVCNAHDIDGIVDMMHPGCEWERAIGDELHGRRFVGRKAISAGIAEYQDLCPNFVYTDVESIVADPHAVIEWTLSYDRGEKRFTVRGVDVMTFEDGLIKTKHTYHKRRTA